MLFFLLVFAVIDFGRFIYIRNIAFRDAEAAARAMATYSDSDCAAWTAARANGNPGAITVDATSIQGDPPPGPGFPAAPGPNQGTLYLYPAMATTATCASGGPSRPSNTKVEAVVIYSFSPLTPLVARIVGDIQIIAVDNVSITEY